MFKGHSSLHSSSLVWIKRNISSAWKHSWKPVKRIHVDVSSPNKQWIKCKVKTTQKSSGIIFSCSNTRQDKVILLPTKICGNKATFFKSYDWYNNNYFKV